MARPCPICDLEPQVLTCGNVVLDRRVCTLTVDGEVVHVEPSVFALLELLMCDPGRVWSREKLSSQLDPAGERYLDNAIQQWVHRARRAIGDSAEIRTEYRYGYYITDSEQNPMQREPGDRHWRYGKKRRLRARKEECGICDSQQQR